MGAITGTARSLSQTTGFSAIGDKHPEGMGEQMRLLLIRRGQGGSGKDSLAAGRANFVGRRLDTRRPRSRPYYRRGNKRGKANDRPVAEKKIPAKSSRAMHWSERIRRTG